MDTSGTECFLARNCVKSSLASNLPFEEYSVAECLAYELSGAIFDGVTFGAQTIEVEY